MNSLINWSPLRELNDWENQVQRVLGLTPRGGNGGKESMTVANWSPLVDITEDDEQYLVKAEMPDLKKEDVKVKVENGELTISGERKLEKEENRQKFPRIERAYGSFMRSFTLPEDVRAEKVAAEFKDGLLTVHLPKDEKAKPRSVEVKVD